MKLMKLLPLPKLAFLAATLAFAPALAQPPATPAAAQPAAASVVLAGPERTQALAAANRALNATRTLQGRFRQVSPDGASTAGAFYLQRPGRLRFEYDPPATLLIVANANTLYMRDRELRTTERTTLDSTPLNLILKQNIDLARDSRVTRVAREGSALLITARDRSGRTDGEITLRLDGAGLDLHSWDVVDATGSRTRVWLSDVTHPESFDRRLFRVEDVLDPVRRGPR
jgi:outer membrane lipoprotein-sorting protein